jgi:hypothetical protein
MNRSDMPDFTIRSDSVNVEQIMEQIRSRIREKRGVDYTEQQIRELAAVKLEKFLDPRGVRSDLLEQFRRAQPAYTPPELPNYAFEDETLFASTRPALRWMRKLLNPILKLFFNPNPLIQALNIQSRLNNMYSEREARREATRRAFDQLQYELMHNLVIETTRMSIEVKNLKMRVESLSSRLEFNERRARALESVVVYKPSAEDSAPRPDAPAPSGPAPIPRDRQERHDHTRGPAAAKPQNIATGEAVQGPGQAGQGSATPGPEGPGQRSRRRRRRRGRRGGGSAAALMGSASSQTLGSGTTPPAGDPTFSAAFASHTESPGPVGQGPDAIEQEPAPTSQATAPVANPPPDVPVPPARNDADLAPADDPGHDPSQ